MRDSNGGKGGDNIFRSKVRLRVVTLAHVAERTGLAMVGASCGLFVAAAVDHSSIEGLRSLGICFAMIVIGALGFYLGVDVPSPSAETSEHPLFSVSPTTKINSVEVLSAAGTFLAAIAVLVSVDLIVFDADLPTPWILAFGLSWLIGTAMQVVAGIAARLRESTRVHLDGVRKYESPDGRKQPALSSAHF